MEAAMVDQYVIIEIGAERHALKVSDINEIIKLQKITEVPGSKPFLEGVTNLRGKIVPIISLRKRFVLAEAQPSKQTRIVVVDHGGELIGMIVDAVHQVTSFAEIQPSGEIVSGLDGQYFTGIGYSDDGLISILSLTQVLDG